MEQLIEWKIKGLYKADAEKCYAEIQSMGETTTPAKILEYAKDENSELHKCFEWNDSQAAEKYRLIQARDIIRSLVFVPQKENTPAVRVLNITTQRNTYQPTTLFLKQQDEYSELLKRALAELQAFKRKYSTLSELETILAEIDSLIA